MHASGLQSLRVMDGINNSRQSVAPSGFRILRFRENMPKCQKRFLD